MLLTRLKCYWLYLTMSQENISLQTHTWNWLFCKEQWKGIDTQDLCLVGLKESTVSHLYPLRNVFGGKG